jgi:hypothetical protein
VTVTKICFGVGPKFELTAVPGSRRVDARRSQTLQVIAMLPWTYHVDSLIATLKPILYEWKQHVVLFVVTVEKRADMTYVAELRAREGNWRHGLLHGVYPALLWIARNGTTLCLCPLVKVAKAHPLDSPHSSECTSPNPTSIRL